MEVDRVWDAAALNAYDWDELPSKPKPKKMKLAELVKIAEEKYGPIEVVGNFE